MSIITTFLLFLLCACAGYLISIEHPFGRSFEIPERIEKQGDWANLSRRKTARLLLLIVAWLNFTESLCGVTDLPKFLYHGE